ncbi:hypothetical protein [Hyphobacterium sp.]|uniref:hypothetical protein n=1 Tax=Hyphobacterium sp. TaxID=2004662 RepID=UPI0037487B69
MSSIPGAHASLGFGRKRVDFYASPGVTAGEGQRRGEHEIRDADGASHSMRLSRPDTPLETGETVTVLRAQSGPDHGSRPVAVINHDRNAWTRTAPEATAVLARSGITRATNWWLTMLLFMAAAIAFSWSDIRLFMLEVDPGIFASLPEFNIFNIVAAAIPAQVGFDFAAAIPGFGGLVDQLGLPGWLSAQTLAFALPLTAIALITYFARSWRIIWAPVYVFAAIATGLALAPESPLMPAILALAGVALLFCVGGFINRTRDAGRLEGRIARLSENILRHPPAETVAAPAAAGAALAATAVADAEAEPDAEADADAAIASADAAEDATDSSDDLPSDEELAAARSESENADPSPVPSMAATAEEASVEETSTSDRDMVMPPPPPLANRAVSDTAESGEAGVADSDAGETNESDEPATAAASAMQAPTPEPVEAREETPVAADTPATPEADVSDPPATATASAMQAPTPEAAQDAPAIEPSPDTPAAEDVHSFAASGSGPGETLMSSRDIADVEDAAEAPEAPDAAPVTPSTLQNATGDDEPDPFMSSPQSADSAPEPAAEPDRQDDSDTPPRQTDS